MSGRGCRRVRGCCCCLGLTCPPPPPPPPPSAPSSTGILIADKDRPFVARAMVVCLLVLAGFLHWQRAAAPQMSTVWWGLVIFFFTRAVQSLPRVWTTRLRGPAAAA